MAKKINVQAGKIRELDFKMLSYPDFRKRTVFVWLPPGYNEESKPYPVLYMHDGQNLFDAAHSFSGEWEVDETISRYVDNGGEGVIVVGIANSAQRLGEYSPLWPRTTLLDDTPPTGKEYASFIANELVPYIDSHFNTDKKALKRAIGGSSMGGIISFFTALTYPHLFRNALIFSPSFWLYEPAAVQAFIKEQAKRDLENLRLYFYHGTGEGHYDYLTWIKESLVRQGVQTDNIVISLKARAKHNEKAWAKEFKKAFPWLFS